MPSPDPLCETKACDLLARIFRERGYTIVRNIPFHEFGVSFHIDGWDARARVGFEFLTSEDEDHDDLTLEEYQALMAAQLRGELSLFIVDEVEPISPADLRRSAEAFLDEVAEARRAGRTRARLRPMKAGKGTGGTKAARKPATKKPAAKKPAAKKPAAKKPAAKKARRPLPKKATRRR